MDSITLELLFFAIVIYEEPRVFHIFCRYVFNQWKTLKTAISFFRRLHVKGIIFRLVPTLVSCHRKHAVLQCLLKLNAA